MSLQTLLVDDEPLAIDRLRLFLQDIEGVDIVGVARTAEEARRAIAELEPDLVLLDICMPDQSGMALISELDGNFRPEIVFVTALEQFASDAFEFDAVDYLLKPVRLDRLRKAIWRVRRRIEMVEAVRADGASEDRPCDALKEIWVPRDGGQFRLPINMIDRIAAARDYVEIYSGVRQFLVRISMSELETRLDPKDLVRVHRSAFVRPSQVQGIDRSTNGKLELILRDGQTVPVGPNYAKSVLRQLGLAAH